MLLGGVMATKVPSELKAKLKLADSIVRDYVSQLEARNAKRQRQIVQLESDKVELNGRIKALTEQLKAKKVDFRYSIDAGLVGRASDLLKQFRETPETIKKRIRELEEKLGIPPEKRCQF